MKILTLVLAVVLGLANAEATNSSESGSCNAGSRWDAEKKACIAVICPRESIGASVVEGCDCELDHEGQIKPSTKSPFYSGECKPHHAPSDPFRQGATITDACSDLVTGGESPFSCATYFEAKSLDRLTSCRRPCVSVQGKKRQCVASRLCQDCAALIDGGGWTLVRHTASTGGWGPWNDNLEGTATHGSLGSSSDTKHWTIRWDSSKKSQYLFSLGDCSQWLIADKAAVVGGTGTILKSSTSPTTSSKAKWYNRASNAEDPWISTNDHQSCTVPDSNNCMLYGENSFNADSHAHAKNAHGGANVYVRVAPFKKTVRLNRRCGGRPGNCQFFDCTWQCTRLPECGYVRCGQFKPCRYEWKHPTCKIYQQVEPSMPFKQTVTLRRGCGGRQSDCHEGDCTWQCTRLPECGNTRCGKSKPCGYAWTHPVCKIYQQDTTATTQALTYEGYTERSLVAEEGGSKGDYGDISLEDCKYNCDATEGCNSFTYKMKERWCRLKDKQVTMSDSASTATSASSYKTYFKE